MISPAIDNTRRMLDVLDEDELGAVQGVARVFVMNSPFGPKSEEELFERIDRSLAQADAGELQDADEALDEVLTELAL